MLIFLRQESTDETSFIPWKGSLYSHYGDDLEKYEAQYNTNIIKMKMANRTFAEALSAKAVNKTIVLSVMDIAYKDMALNMLYSIQLQGVTNSLMVSQVSVCDVNVAQQHFN